MNRVERVLAKMSFAGQTKIRILRQLQRLIHSGVRLNQSLDMLHHLYSKGGTKPREPLALMVGEWRTKISEGKPLSMALRGWVTPTEELIIQAGEQSQRLAGSLDDALQANGAAGAIQKAIIGGIAYPIVMVVFLCFILYGFATEIVPTFATILPPEEWRGNAAVMYGISQFIVSWGLTVALSIIAAIAAAMASLPYLTGPARPKLDRLPPWSIYKISQGASFMIAMRGFLSAGLPVPDALRRMTKIANPYLLERIRAILARINMGRNLGQAMRESKLGFPDNDIAGEISIYAELDGFSEALDLLAKEWITGATERAKTASKIMNAVMLILIAMVIGYTFLSLYDLQQQVTQAARRY